VTPKILKAAFVVLFQIMHPISALKATIKGFEISRIKGVGDKT
jgi:hypothetical protein